MFLFILHCLGNSTNIYDFKCAATEKRKIFSFFFCIGCYLLPLPPSLILHLVILILYMFAFCCMCACVFHLVVCFVFGSFVFAVCISVGRSFNYLEMYTHASYICIYIQERKKRKKKKLFEALSCHPQTKMMLIFWIRWTQVTKKKKRKKEICSPYLSTQFLIWMQFICWLLSSWWIFPFAFIFFVYFFRQ